MAGGEGGLVPQIEQRDFLAQQQRAADLRGRDGGWGHDVAGLGGTMELSLARCAGRFNSQHRHCERSEAIHGAARKKSWIASLRSQ